MQFGGKYLNRQFQNWKMGNKAISKFLVVSKQICGWVMARGPVLLRFEILLFSGECVLGLGVGTSHHRVTGALGPRSWHQLSGL